MAAKAGTSSSGTGKSSHAAAPAHDSAHASSVTHAVGETRLTMPTHVHAAGESSKHKTTGLDMAIEVGEVAHKAAEGVHKVYEKANAALKFYTGSQAFRSYSWIKNAPIMNKAGNFRGMVVNSKWKAAFDVTVENAEKLEKYGNYLTVAGVVLDVVKQHERIGKMLDSNMPTSEKAQHLITMGSMAVFNAIGSPVPLVAHHIASPLARAANIFPKTRHFAQDIRLMDSVIQSSYKEMMDSENVVHYINTHLVLSDAAIDKIISWQQGASSAAPRRPAAQPQLRLP